MQMRSALPSFASSRLQTHEALDEPRKFLGSGPNESDPPPTPIGSVLLWLSTRTFERVDQIFEPTKASEYREQSRHHESNAILYPSISGPGIDLLPIRCLCRNQSDTLSESEARHAVDMSWCDSPVDDRTCSITHVPAPGPCLVQQ